MSDFCIPYADEVRSVATWRLLLTQGSGFKFDESLY